MIELKNVTKTYDGDVTGVDNLSLTIEDGEFVFLVGESGSGKSTLLKLLMRELVPTEGSITIDGKEITKLRRKKVAELRRNMGIVFQDYRLLQKRTVYENVAFALEVIEIPTTRLRIKILDTTKLTAKRIKVSLYKRISTTAAEQEYELVDLKDFVTNELPGSNDMTYDLTENPKELIFDNKKFENNGYELRFELYDGTRKITTAKKKFIVK